MKRTLISLGLMGLLLCGLILPAGAQKTQEETSPALLGQLEPLTKEYLAWSQLSPEEQAQRRMPSPTKLSRARGVAAQASYPTQYDARDLGYLTPVRNQGYTNTCWTFSGSINAGDYFAYQAYQEGGSASPVFSPRHMEYSLSHIPGQPDTGLEWVDKTLDTGGNQYFAASYWFNGMGPVSEEDCPFLNHDLQWEGDTPILTPHHASRAQLQVEPAAQILSYQLSGYTAEDFPADGLPTQTMINDVKGYVYQYGSCDVGLYYDETYWNEENTCYYWPEQSVQANHAVVAVGWDDNYPRENFSEDPGMDGAWIIQNSWGTSWGEEGFFYVSYADWSIYELFGSVTDGRMGAPDYDNRYLYDVVNFGAYGEGESHTGYGANVYHKQAGTELLTEVVLQTTPNTTSYEVYVSPTGSLEKEDWLWCAAGEGTGSSGYETVTLPEPVTLTGDTFAVIVRYTAKDYEYPVPTSLPASLSGTPGCSYIYLDTTQTWEDMGQKGGLVCPIKAFTKDAEDSPKTQVTLHGEKDAVFYVYQESGERIMSNADGSYNLAQGETYLFQEFLPGTEGITSKWGSFSVAAEDTLQVQAEEHCFTNVDYAVSGSPAAQYTYGQRVDASDLTVTISFPGTAFAPLVLTSDRLADYGISLSSNYEDKTFTMEDNGKTLEYELSFYDRVLDQGRVTLSVEKATPRIKLWSDADSYAPGQTMTLHLQLLNSSDITESFGEGLPRLDDLTVTSDLGITLRDWSYDPEAAVPVYTTILTLPAELTSTQISFAVESKETACYTAGREELVVPIDQPNPFLDVQEGDYFYEAVLWAAANGITNGTSETTFRPDATVTRAQMVTFLWRAAGSPAPEETETPFTDLTETAYYRDAVLWAYASGITNGTSATTFAPDGTVTRAQAVTFQWNAAGKPSAAGKTFPDVPADAYYAPAVTWAVEQGITNGTSETTFRPDGPVTRGQAATFLWREQL